MTVGMVIQVCEVGVVVEVLLNSSTRSGEHIVAAVGVFVVVGVCVW